MWQYEVLGFLPAEWHLLPERSRSRTFSSAVHRARYFSPFWYLDAHRGNDERYDVSGAVCGLEDYRDLRSTDADAHELRPNEDKKSLRKEFASVLRNAIQSVLSQPDAGQPAQSSVSLVCPLNDDEYDLEPVQVHANEYEGLVLRLENPLRKTLTSVHVCFKDFDLFYMPWTHRARPKNEPIAGGYHYYWDTDNQLGELANKPQTVRFILNGTRCGEHDLVVAWGADGTTHERRIRVVVEPEPG